MHVIWVHLTSAMNPNGMLRIENSKIARLYQTPMLRRECILKGPSSEVGSVTEEGVASKHTGEDKRCESVESHKSAWTQRLGLLAKVCYQYDSRGCLQYE